MSDIDEDIALLERLEKEATPGPWIDEEACLACEEDGKCIAMFVETPDREANALDRETLREIWKLEAADIKLVVALRNKALGVISRLLAKLRIAETERDEAIERVKAMRLYMERDDEVGLP